MQLRTIRGVKVESKKVLLRVDFNVPIKNGKVEDEYKIQCALPTINYLLRRGMQVIVVSHFGRPQGRRIQSMSLKPVYNVLKLKLRPHSVKFIPDKINSKSLLKIAKTPEGVILLENIRFEKGEDENSAELARRLSRIADIYVNDAFACSHRKAASISAITKYLKPYAGLNLEREVLYLSRALEPRKPAIALIGGAKIESKLPMIKNFLKVYDYILVGGGIANTFLKTKEYNVGSSLIDKGYLTAARQLVKNRKIILPCDVLVGFNNGKERVRDVKIGSEQKICSSKEKILDIGPRTIIYYSNLIRQANTIIWAGPMGCFENKKFSHGTLTLAKIIGARASGKALGIAGGGETLMAIHQSKMGRYYDFISTGGGAMLEFLSGKKLPGLRPLIMDK